MSWRAILSIVVLLAATDVAAKKSLAGLAALRPRLDPMSLPEVPAACVDYLTTGFDWHYFNRPSLAPTSWYLMASVHHNPLAFEWVP